MKTKQKGLVYILNICTNDQHIYSWRIMSCCWKCAVGASQKDQAMSINFNLITSFQHIESKQQYICHNDIKAKQFIHSFNKDKGIQEIMF
jgi:hypothetical protein